MAAEPAPPPTLWRDRAFLTWPRPRAALGVAALGSLALMAGLALTPLRAVRSIEDAA